MIASKSTTYWYLSERKKHMNPLKLVNFSLQFLLSRMAMYFHGPTRFTVNQFPSRSPLTESNFFRLLLILLILLLLRIVYLLVGMMPFDSNDPSVYLYYGEKDSSPVIEFRPIDTDEAVFLIQPQQYNFVVVYYAHWCHHCQVYRTQYVEVAREVTELLKDTEDDVKFYAISCVANWKICNNQTIDSYPTVHLYDTNDRTTNHSEISSWKVTAAAIIQKFKLTVDKDKLKNIQKIIKQQQEQQQETHSTGIQTSTTWPIRTRQQMIDDIYVSFDYNLRHSIFTSNNALDDVKKNALYDWLLLLEKTLPVSLPMNLVLTDLIDNFDDITRSEADLHSILNQHPYHVNVWSDACSKGEDGMGYTCGLWELLHTATIGFVEHNQRESKGNGNYMSTLQAGETIKNFITHFFQCEVCRQNFVKEYDNCSYDRCNRLDSDIEPNLLHWIQLPLWFIELHNGVNVRLLHESVPNGGDVVSEFEVNEKKWPSKRMCPDCWSNTGEIYQENLYRYAKLEYYSSFGAKEVESFHSSKFLFKSIPSISFFVAILLGFGWFYKKISRRNRMGLHKKIQSF